MSFVKKAVKETTTGYKETIKADLVAMAVGGLLFEVRANAEHLHV
jgi:hypothetical protein